jgi:hypothetical protein
MKSSFGRSRINWLWFGLLLGLSASLSTSNAQTTNDVQVAPEAPAVSQGRQFVSPFSGVPLRAYAVTNFDASGAGIVGVGGLYLDPFSRTPLGIAKPLPKAVGPERMPERILPIIVELPPGASISRVILATESSVAAGPVGFSPVKVPLIFAESTRFDFPPAARVRREP